MQDEESKNMEKAMPAGEQVEEHLSPADTAEDGSRHRNESPTEPSGDGRMPANGEGVGGLQESRHEEGEATDATEGSELLSFIGAWSFFSILLFINFEAVAEADSLFFTCFWSLMCGLLIGMFCMTVANGYNPKIPKTVS